VDSDRYLLQSAVRRHMFGVEIFVLVRSWSMNLRERRRQVRQGSPRTISIPQAGWQFFGIGEAASYAAAARGEIPYIQIGGLKRVPVVLMEQRFLQAGGTASSSGDVGPPPLAAAGSE
jgi:hypothetical protein